MDFPTAWAIVNATRLEDHDPRCSYAQTNRAILCDCHVLTSHPQYSSAQAQVPADEATTTAGRPFAELSSSGLLWLLNRVTFHPRGLALALHTDDQGAVTGWNLLAHPAREPYSFTPEVDHEYATHAEDTINQARLSALLGHEPPCST